MRHLVISVGLEGLLAKMVIGSYLFERMTFSIEAIGSVPF